MRGWHSAVVMTLLPVLGPTACARRAADFLPRTDLRAQAHSPAAPADMDADAFSARGIARRLSWPSLPPAPEVLSSPEESRAAMPGWVRQRPGTYVPGSPLTEALFKEAARSPSEEAMGLVCRAQVRGKPGLAHRVSVFLAGKQGLHAEGFGTSDCYVLVPLVDPRATDALRIDAVQVPNPTLPQLAFALLTAFPLPFLAAERESPVAQALLERKPAGRQEASGEVLSAECLPVARSALERAAAPVLASAWTALTRSSPRLRPLDSRRAEVEEHAVPPEAQRIVEAAALLGWSDPRVRALVDRAEGMLRLERVLAAEQIQAEVARLAGTGPLPLLRGRATLLASWLDCARKPGRTTRKHGAPAPAPKSCVLRLRVRNEGQEPLDEWTTGWHSWEAFTSDGRSLHGGDFWMETYRSPRVSSLRWVIAPGAEGELVAEVFDVEGSGARPWLLRLRVPGAGFDVFVAREQAPE